MILRRGYMGPVSEGVVWLNCEWVNYSDMKDQQLLFISLSLEDNLCYIDVPETKKSGLSQLYFHPMDSEWMHPTLALRISQIQNLKLKSYWNAQSDGCNYINLNNGF